MCIEDNISLIEIYWIFFNNTLSKNLQDALSHKRFLHFTVIGVLTHWLGNY